MPRITSRNRPRASATIVNEALEPRRLMASIAWDGGGNGTLWSDPNNWSPNQVPTANDSVTIDVPGNTTRVEIHGSTNASVFNIDCHESLDVRGSLTVGSASVVRGPLRLFGSVAGPGNFQVYGYTEVYNNANLIGPGRFTVGPTGRMVIGPKPITTFTVGRDLWIENGQVDWLSGQIRLNDARIENDGLFRTGTTPLDLSMVTVGGQTALANRASGLIQVRAGTMTLGDVALENDDDIDIAANARLVQTAGGGGGFDRAGRFNLLASTSSLALAGHHFYTPAASIAGPGGLELAGVGTLDMGGTIDVDALVVTGRDVRSSGPLTANRLEVRGGAKFTRANGASLPATIVAGELAAHVGDITFNGDVDWRGGRLLADDGSRFIVPALRRVIATTNAHRTLSATLVVNGEFQFDGGEIVLDRGTIENNNLIRLNPTDSAHMYEDQNGGRIFNSNAAIIKNGAGSALIDVDVVHSALSYVAVNAGSLRLGGDNTNLRLAQTVAGTTLALAGDNTFTGATSLDGVRGHLRIEGGDSTYAGGLTQQQSLTFAGGAFTVGGNVRGIVDVTDGAANLNGATNIFDGGSMSGGALGGTGPVAIRGTFTWGAGELTGSGVVTVEAGSALNIQGNPHSLGRRLVNDGFTHWSGGDILMLGGAGNAHVENNGTFVARSDADLRFVQATPDGASAFVNNGHFAKQLGGALVVPPPQEIDAITFANHGQVVVAGGRFEVRSAASHTGDFHVDAAAELIFADSHTLSDTSVLSGQGVVRLRDAQVHVNGDQGFATGRLLVEGQSAVAFRGTRTWIGSLELRDGAQASLPVGGDHLLLVHALAIGPAAKLEINDNPVVIDYTGASPIDTIAAALASGYAGGTWNGGGICSKFASLTPGVGIGYAEASDLFGNFPATFAGQALDNTAVVVRAATYGDANLDGNVNLADFNRLAANFGSTSGSWSRGDFTYDGAVTLADFNALAANFGRTSAPSSAPDASDGDEDVRNFVGTTRRSRSS